MDIIEDSSCPNTPFALSHGFIRQTRLTSSLQAQDLTSSAPDPLTEEGGNANVPLTPRVAEHQLAQGLHSDIFKASQIMCIDPLRCISLRKLRTRSISRWGIKVMKESIVGHRNVESFVQGFVSTGKFSVIVLIPEDRQDLIVEHFIEEGKSQVDAESMASSGSWWHVVDGGHMHGGLALAIHEFPQKFGGFKWPVVLISWQGEDTLRAISRMCNEMQKEGHLIDFTLPDAMQNLRAIADAQQASRDGVDSGRES